MTSDIFHNSERLLHSLDEKPSIIFSKKTESVEKLLKNSLKELNDCFIRQQKRSANKLQELYVNKFDEEQLWSQMKSNDNLVNLKTDDWISSMLTNIDQVSLLPSGKQPQKEVKKKKNKDFDEKAWMAGEDIEEEDEDVIEEEEGDFEGEGEEEERFDGEEDFGGEEQDVTDDEAEMREFEKLDKMLEEEEIKIDDDDEEEEDEEEEGLEDLPADEDDEEERELEEGLRKYRLVEGEDEEEEEEAERKEINDAEVEDDIFEKAREELLGDDDEEEEDVLKGKSAHLSEIETLEKKLLDKKAWQTQGEVKAGQRPVNSLLQENLDYNITKKAAQKITPEYSGNLEDIIKQRILDEAWDDPIEYVMGKGIKETFNNLEEINFEKSQKGLGELYEEDYKKNIMGIKQATPDDENKKEIDLLFKKLSYNLDVLSNLNFTPKPIFDTAKIVPNVASIRLEEKTPLGFSTRQTNAPQELFNPDKAQFESKEEFTTAENRAARRQVKRNIRTRNKEKKKKELIKNLEFKGQTKYEYNLKKKSIEKYATEVKKKNQKSVEFTKSSQFFNNLQKSNDKKKQPAAAEEPVAKRKNYMI